VAFPVQGKAMSH
jgi:hypothetical protein